MNTKNRSGEKQKFFDMKGFLLLQYINKKGANIESILNAIGSVFILIIMFFTAAEIVSRYVFNHPIPGYVENVELIMAAVVFLGLGYTQRVEAQIRMDLVIIRIKGRLYYIIEALSLLLSLIVFVIICIFTFQSTIDAYQFGDVTEYLYTPTWPSKLCVPLGSFFLCTRLTLQIIKNIAQAVIGVEVKELE